jgi:hypothetical protein
VISNAETEGRYIREGAGHRSQKVDNGDIRNTRSRREYNHTFTLSVTQTWVHVWVRQHRGD